MISMVGHMTDSQSWPLSLPGLRDLADKGAYSAEEIYNEHDVTEITRYAAEVSDFGFSHRPQQKRVSTAYNLSNPIERNRRCC